MRPRANIILLLVGTIALISCANHARPAQGTDLTLKPAPRLWVSKDTALHLREKLHTPYLQNEARRVIEDADWLVDAEPLSEADEGSYQSRTRTIASHLQCLTSAWVLTREQKYRDAAMRHLANLLTWNQISCEARPGMPYEHQMFFCLSYGEHAADIGLMYDLFRPDITPEEQKIFFAVLDRFHLKEALRAARKPPWWAMQWWSNWNGVCAGGMGIMALAFYDDRPECRELIPFVEQSLEQYFTFLVRDGGGNHEGTGYWNYGMHYAMRYVLSWENATGRTHPVFKIKELQKTLDFPLDFTGITFGDNDGWHASGMFFMLADRLDHPDAALRAAAHLSDRPYAPRDERNRLSRVATGDILYAADHVPTFDAVNEDRMAHEREREPIARVYEGLGWGILADDSTYPSLRLSVRGGSNAVRGHGHIDLLSFKCMVNGQRMIEDQQGSGGHIAFTGRGHELYERSAAAKSTLFVDGLSCGVRAECDEISVLRDGDLLGIRVDGAGAYMSSWRRQFLGRLFLMVENRYWLVIDSAQGHQMESRFHTYANLERGKDWAILTRDKEQMTMTFAAVGRGVMQESRGTPTRPQKTTHILRWMGGSGLHVTALNPGTDRLDIKVKRRDGGYTITISGTNSYQRSIHLTPGLQLIR